MRVFGRLFLAYGPVRLLQAIPMANRSRLVNHWSACRCWNNYLAAVTRLLTSGSSLTLARKHGAGYLTIKMGFCSFVAIWKRSFQPLSLRISLIMVRSDGGKAYS